MDGLTILFVITSVVGVTIAAWLNTKSGKKWLSNL